MVNTSVMPYNTTEISANSFSDLLVEGNALMGGSLAYGLIFVVWIVSMSVLSQYPNTDSLKASSYTAWLTSVLFAIFGVIRPDFPLVLLILLAALTAYDEVGS